MMRYVLCANKEALYMLVKQYDPELPDLSFCDFQDEGNSYTLSFVPDVLRDQRIDVYFSIFGYNAGLLFSCYDRVVDAKNVIRFETVPLLFLQQMNLVREVVL